MKRFLDKLQGFMITFWAGAAVLLLAGATLLIVNPLILVEILKWICILGSTTIAISILSVFLRYLWL